VDQDVELESVVGVRRLPPNRYILRFDSIDQAKCAHGHVLNVSMKTDWNVQYVQPAIFNMATGFENPLSAGFEADVVVVASALGSGTLPSDVPYAHKLFDTVQAMIAADFRGAATVRQLVSDCYENGQVAFRFEMDSVTGADTMLRGWNKGVLATVAGDMSQVSPALFDMTASHCLQVMIKAHYYEAAQDPMEKFAPRHLGGLRTVTVGNPYAGQVGGQHSQKRDDGRNIVPANIIGNKEFRTTVMLRNIPNKLQSFEVKRILDAIMHGRFDFLYVRTDFSNLCNVGYAFINFVDAKDVLLFYKAIHGRKWNVYNSDKVAELCYATVQGTDRLIDRFRNSGVQGQWAPFRAKLFLCSGDKGVDAAKWGTESPFPAFNNKAKVRYPPLLLSLFLTLAVRAQRAECLPRRPLLFQQPWRPRPSPHAADHCGRLAQPVDRVVRRPVDGRLT
jgi:hypothetical protein